MFMGSHGFTKVCDPPILLVFGRNDKSFAQGELGNVRLTGFGVARRGTGELASNNKQQDNKIRWWLQVHAHPNRQFINLNKDENQLTMLK